MQSISLETNVYSKKIQQNQSSGFHPVPSLTPRDLLALRDLFRSEVQSSAINRSEQCFYKEICMRTWQKQMRVHAVLTPQAQEDWDLNAEQQRKRESVQSSHLQGKSSTLRLTILRGMTSKQACKLFASLIMRLYHQ